MKGGKEGRKRRSSSAGATPRGTDRAKVAKSGKRAPGAAPKKGSRKKTFGAMPTPRDEQD
jgi:hypothetical protein